MKNNDGSGRRDGQRLKQMMKSKTPWFSFMETYFHMITYSFLPFYVRPAVFVYASMPAIALAGGWSFQVVCVSVVYIYNAQQHNSCESNI